MSGFMLGIHLGRQIEVLGFRELHQLLVRLGMIRHHPLRKLFHLR
jgi:hypothetical protein